MLCVYCNREIKDNPVNIVCENCGRPIPFCSLKCAWKANIQTHKKYGLSGKQARRHLIDIHGFPSSQEVISAEAVLDEFATIIAEGKFRMSHSRGIPK